MDYYYLFSIFKKQVLSISIQIALLMDFNIITHTAAAVINYYKHHNLPGTNQEKYRIILLQIEEYR